MDLRARLATLTREFDAGELKLQALDQERKRIEAAMLRIDGARTLLAELLEHERASGEDRILDGLTGYAEEGE